MYLWVGYIVVIKEIRVGFVMDRELNVVMREIGS